MGWPSDAGHVAEESTLPLGVYSTDSDGHCFFYGPTVGAVDEVTRHTYPRGK